MADFCLGCMVTTLGMPAGTPADLAGLSTPEDTAAGLYASAICEGCGVIQVDHEGRRVTPGPCGPDGWAEYDATLAEATHGDAGDGPAAAG